MADILPGCWAVYLGTREGVFSVNSRARPGKKLHVQYGKPFRIELADRWIYHLPDYVGLSTFDFTPKIKRIPRAKPDYLPKYSAAWLEGLAAHTPDPARIVEIGTASGTSLLRILYGLQLHHDAFVWSIDIQDCPEAIEHIKQAPIPAWRYALITLPSTEAALRHTEPLDMIYIDGAHGYAAVKADIEAWRSHLKPSGVMAFDDYGNDIHQVTPAVDEMMFGWECIGQVGYLIAFEKPNASSKISEA